MPQPRKYASRAERQAAYRRRTQSARAAEQQRKGLPPQPAIATMPGTARWRAAIVASRALLEMVREEMEDYAGDRSEAWQESERAEQHQEWVDALESLIGEFDSVV